MYILILNMGSIVDFLTYTVANLYSWLVMHFSHWASFCGNHIRPNLSSKALINIDSSVANPHFWWLVLAQGVVGIGSSGMAYMVALMLNGQALPTFSEHQN